MGTVIDLMTRLPIEIWFNENPRASDVKFELDIFNLVKAKTLLLLDRGFYHFRALVNHGMISTNFQRFFNGFKR